MDYTGTGNTVNANHPVVRDHILAALRYWVLETHVDGFRFDLASILGLDGSDANFSENYGAESIRRSTGLHAG